MEYYSTMKKNEIMPFATTQMNLESTVFRELSDRERQVLYGNISMWTLKDNTIEEASLMAQMVKKLPAMQLHDTIYTWTLKNKTIESIYKIKTADIENKLMVTKGEGGEGQIRTMSLIDIHYCI